MIRPLQVSSCMSMIARSRRITPKLGSAQRTPRSSLIRLPAWSVDLASSSRSS
jgi:hypothetical protein